MKTIQKLVVSAAVATVFFGMAGCSGMSAQDKNTAIGAGVASRHIVSGEVGRSEAA